MTLLSDCASAATAAEARFRIDYPNSLPRATRIVALDEGAAAAMRKAQTATWNDARFLVCLGRSRGVQGLDSIPPDLDLRAPDGSVVRLSDELSGADAVVMVATAAADHEAAATIGDACRSRRVAATGLLVALEDAPNALGPTLAALRPTARMLVVASEAEYIPEMLAALRA